MTGCNRSVAGSLATWALWRRWSASSRRRVIPSNSKLAVATSFRSTQCDMSVFASTYIWSRPTRARVWSRPVARKQRSICVLVDLSILAKPVADSCGGTQPTWAYRVINKCSLPTHIYLYSASMSSLLNTIIITAIFVGSNRIYPV